MGQKRDTDLEAFGRHIRALRGRRSLRDVAAAVSTGKSTLSRIERGQVFPNATIIEQLDHLFDQRGALIRRRLRLLAAATSREPSPWRRRWIHHYPAHYVGEVFLHIVVPTERRPAHVKLKIQWGPWRLAREVRIHDADGVVLAHAKGDDGLSIPVIIDLDVPAAVSFCTGVPPSRAIDINAGWERDASIH